MKQSKTPSATLSSKTSNQQPKSVSPNSAAASVFIGMALDMSWRLAIVVLVPIIGGFELDKKFNTSPLLTIVGFILAMVGMALVLKRMLKVVNITTNEKDKS
jgi:F0F1-type ATP synthase assembly protein I